jgi:hypothetical protein
LLFLAKKKKLSGAKFECGTITICSFVGIIEIKSGSASGNHAASDEISSTYTNQTQRRTIMIRKLSAAMLAVMMVAFFASNASAQFEKGKNYIGARIGFGAIGFGFSLGADYEYGITNPNEVGPGRIGIGGTLDWSHYSSGVYGVTWIPISVLGYYHLDLDNKNLDPFAGIGLGYWIVSSSPSGYTYSSGIEPVGQLGVRYFFQPNLAAQARIGFGASALSVGIDYKF